MLFTEHLICANTILDSQPSDFEAYIVAERKPKIKKEQQKADNYKKKIQHDSIKKPRQGKDKGCIIQWVVRRGGSDICNMAWVMR